MLFSSQWLQSYILILYKQKLCHCHFAILIAFSLSFAVETPSVTFAIENSPITNHSSLICVKGAWRICQSHWIPNSRICCFSRRLYILGGAFAIRASSMAFDLLKFSRPRPHDERRQRGRRVDHLGRGHGFLGHTHPVSKEYHCPRYCIKPSIINKEKTSNSSIQLLTPALSWVQPLAGRICHVAPEKQAKHTFTCSPSPP